ncbi:hypothetical protein [Burkholderia gladioli]|uniref:hypothetical protein n=1 Tax=Burkholderia gladioli TaxID=28095 RepID=UPI00163DEFFD|nr:hypothetical protein [Burkholderia gladioli]
MTTTDVPADYQSSARPIWPSGASCHVQSAAEILPSGRFADAEMYVRRWTEALDRARDRLTRVQREVADAVAELKDLEVEVAQRPSQSITIYSRRLGLELRLNSARLKESKLLFQIRRFEAVQEEKAKGLEQSWQAVGYGLASPAMAVWQGFLNETRPEVLDVPTQLALAEELAELGLLFDGQDGFIADATYLWLGGVARQMARDFFFGEIAEPFVQNYLVTRSLAAATVRQLVDRWSRERTSETGSAAAIARRMHPLGAPPNRPKELPWHR